METILKSRLWLGLALCVLLGACHKRTDPLEAQRKALLERPMEREDVTPNHVAIELSAGQVSGLVEKFARLEAQKNERVYMAGPMGLPMEAVNVLETVTLEYDKATCEGCVDVALSLAGNSELGSGLSSLKAPMTWNMQVTGQVALGIRQRRVWLDPKADWTVRSSVEGLPAMLNDVAASTLKEMIAEQLRNAKLDAPVSMLELPSDLPFQVASVEAVASEAFSVRLGLYLNQSSEVSEAAPPETGWRVRIPKGTVAGILESVLLRQPPAGGFATALDRVELEDGAVIVLQLLRANKRAAARSVTLRTHWELNSEEGRLVVDSVDLGPHQKGWHTVGTRFVGKKGLKKWMKKSAELSFKRVWSKQTPGLMTTIQLQNLNTVQNELVLEGDIAVEALKSDPENDEQQGSEEKNAPEGSSPQE